MRGEFKLLIALFLTLGMISCDGPNPKNWSEFASWFYQAENGYVKSQKMNHLLFSVQYRPAELAALNELKALEGSYTVKKVDSLVGLYQDGLHFMLSVKPEEKHDDQGNLLFNEAKSYQEYSERFELLAFEMQEYFRLKVGDKELVPVLTHFEPGYDQQSEQRLMVSFDRPKEVSEEMILEFHDPVFKAGKMRFRFEPKKLNKPELPK